MDATPTCDRREDLVAHLYGEGDLEERERFDTHLASCESCAAEVDALRAVRGSLEAWAPPETELGFRLRSGPPQREGRWWRSVALRPAWGLAAAAAACVVAAVALGALDFRRESGGLVIRMGLPVADGVVTAPAAPGAPDGAESADDALMRRIRTLIEQSERRQQQELATRLLALAQEFDVQRREDQVRVQQEVGALADYLVRVSGR